MRNLVCWAITNAPAMNMLMIGVLAVGTVSLAVMRRETFPEFDLEIVLVSVPYPGASPEEVEQGICQKIEEAVRSVDGIKKMTSVAKEGAGSVVLELEADVRDVQKVVTDIRSQVDRIPSFPELAEDPEVQQITMRDPAINIAVVAPAQPAFDELRLRAVAEQVRNELLQLGAVSQVALNGARDYQIDVEIDEDTLRKYGLTLQEVARIIGRENLEIPAGTIRSQSHELLLRGKNRRVTGEEIAKLPVLTDPGGVVLTVGDLGTVRDEFADTTAISEVNGRPALVLAVQRTENEDLLAMTAAVRQYLHERQLPGGYELIPWGDRSIDVRDRLNLLIENGAMGLVLVFLVLAIFLELRLAFWVALGIPVALLGAGGALLLGGQTLNMLTMFAFLMALGIVVDDAIVIGENIYAHRQMGKSTVRAAIDGTVEVMPSVVASVSTTIVAFCPLFFVSGIMGKFIAVMPFAVIAMLVISLGESVFVLPCHLAHEDALLFRIFRVLFYPLHFVATLFARLNRRVSSVLDWVIERLYVPTLGWGIRNPWTFVSGGIALLLITGGFIRSGAVPFVIFPKLDSNYIEAKVVFPDGTPAHVTDAATQRIYQALLRVDQQYRAERSPHDAESLLKVVHRVVGQQDDQQGNVSSGSHLGTLSVELVDTGQREWMSEEIIARWRAESGEIAGTESMAFGSISFGPGATPIEFKLLAPAEQFDQLEEAVEQAKQQLAQYPGVFDIGDDSRPGKWELQVRVKDRAEAMGVRTADLAETIRAAYYGAEAMRLQRGRHEIKLMVRYPEEDRRSLADFQDLRVRTGDGAERPLTELAEVTVERGYSEINRVNQLRSITVRADVDEARQNARKVVADLERHFMPRLLKQYPGVQVSWEGQQEQTRESLRSLFRAMGVALLVMLVLLTLEFRSYAQPLLIMAIIPFGLIGAVLGHAVMGLPLTLFSFFGLVALTGVVVNDSIVLIDFINHRLDAGEPLERALLDAGRRRFRPVLLTSATTVAGLLPILLETSFQAQILIPMATSLGFGLLLATFLVLLLIPVYYRLYRQLVPPPPKHSDEHDRASAPQPRTAGSPRPISSG